MLVHQKKWRAGLKIWKSQLEQIDLFATKYSNLLLSFLLYYHSPLRVYLKYIYAPDEKVSIRMQSQIRVERTTKFYANESRAGDAALTIC